MLRFLMLLGLTVLFPHVAEAKTTFADCGGPNKKISVQGGSVKPDPILYPGNVSMSAAMKVLNDLPSSGLKMSLKLIKLEPRVMPVPCLKDIGSCSYDVCQMIENHKQQFCPMFPAGVKCGCPLKRESYNLKNALVVLPNFGEFFAKLLKGHYNGTITFEDTNKNIQVGCIAVTFDIEEAHK